MPTYVIEHMESDESDGSFPPWVELEYSQMLRLAAPSTVVFSSLSKQSAASLPSTLKGKAKQGDAPFRCERRSILELLRDEDVPLERCCLLDPKAATEISPDDASRFDWFLFGGILGDHPPRDRTGELRKLGFPTRHLREVQMTTDTALAVTKRCVQDRTPLDQIPFVDYPTIKFNQTESVEMPFRYIKDDKGEPILPPGMKELLKADMDKGFDL